MTLTTRASGRIIGGHKEGDLVIELLGSSSLVGHPVINAVGESLGTIREVMIDIGAGRIAYAVLELSGFFGAHDKLFAVPWIALTLDAANHCFILNIDKQRLSEAPCFDRDTWPQMSQPAWSEIVDRFYAAEPFWPHHA